MRLDFAELAFGAGLQQIEQVVLLSRIISTWHSGSPKRAFHSFSFGPRA